MGARLLPIAAAAVLALPGSARAVCSVTTGVDGNGNDKLTIKGDAFPQVIALGDVGVSIQVQVDCNFDGDYADPGDVDQIIGTNFEVIEIAGGGKDLVQYQAVSGAAGIRRALSVLLGPASLSQPNQVAVVFGNVTANSSLTLDVQGGPGLDVLVVQTGNLADSSIAIRGDLGAGDDQAIIVPVAAWTNSTITTDLAMGVGKNLLIDAPVPSASSNSTFKLNALGSDTPAGADQFIFESLGSLDANSRVFHDSRMGAGSDTFTTIVASALTNGSELHGRVRGGLGADTFLTGTGASVNADATSDFSLALSGGAGNDQVTGDFAYVNSGFHRFFLSGGDGSDVVLGGFAADSSANTPNADIFLEGGRGADVVYLGATDPSGNATFNPMGTTLLNGGTFDGVTDVCLFFGDVASDKLDCEVGS
jgi:hypothetical protein